MLRGARRRSRSSLRRYAPLRGGARRPARLPQSLVRRLGGRYPGLHIFVHARLPAIESREEEDVLGTVGIEVQVVVRARRRRWTGGRIVRLLQRLRRRKPLVGPDTGKPLHAESRLGAVQVRRVSFLENLQRSGNTTSRSLSPERRAFARELNRGLMKDASNGTRVMGSLRIQ